MREEQQQRREKRIEVGKKGRGERKEREEGERGEGERGGKERREERRRGGKLESFNKPYSFAAVLHRAM